MQRLPPHRVHRFLALLVFNLAAWTELILLTSDPSFRREPLSWLMTATGVVFWFPLGWLVLVAPGFELLIIPNALFWGMGFEWLIHRFYDLPEEDSAEGEAVSSPLP